jgi:type II secretory pathway component GspD/PulD (secretin)
MHDWCGLILSGTLISGCASPPYAQNEEVNGVVHAYRNQSAQAGQPVGAHGIRALTVEAAAGRPGQFLVSADLDRAPLKLVVERLFEQTRLPHVIQSQPLIGRVTGRFEKHPFPSMLDEILVPNGYSTQTRDGLIVVSEAPAAGASPPAPGAAPAATAPEAAGPTVARGSQLRHLDVETATKFLEGLFPVDPRTGARPIAWAVQPYTSTIYVSGPRGETTRALRLLEEMDRDPAHVLIEALVVELDTAELERFGTDLTNFVNVQISSLASGVGDAAVSTPASPNFVSAAPAALRFLFNSGQNAPRAYGAVIDVLASQSKARIIARPYMAAVSGKQAAIQIQRERTVAVVTGGTTTSDTETIPSGVVMNVTPWVLDSGLVRLDVQVEQSNFVNPPPVGTLVEKDANKAATSMLLRSGQSVVIGGLALQETSSSNGGLPWLRNVPGLSLLTAKQTGSERKQDVLIFVTPYIWTPAVDPPLPHPEAFKFREQDELTAIEQWKKRWIKP